MAYQYIAYTVDKQITKGTIDAVSEKLAEEALYRAGYQRILSLKEVSPGLSLEKLLPTLFGVKTQDVIDFSRQLATLIESGVSILTALQLLEGQASRTVFRKVILGLVNGLRGGSSLSLVLEEYPQAFSHTYCQVIKASEQAGNLEVGLRQVADYMEKRMVVVKKISRAAAYPAFVLVIAIGVFALLITVVLPPLVQLFSTLGAELPWTTRALIATATFFINYRLYLLVGIIALVILIIGYSRLPTGRIYMDRLMLKMPAIGSINIQRNMCQFCETVSMLLKAGLQLPQIMDIVIQTMGNRVVRQALKDIREKLVQGQGLSQPMAETNLFPRIMIEMVVVGEKTGNLDSTLATLAKYYEQRVDQRIDTLVSMIEPTLTLVIGLVVGFIALSMIMPLYSILGAV